MRKRLRALSITLPLLFCGCLFTTQSFNRGKLLPPGVSDVAFGFGLCPAVTESRTWQAETTYYAGGGISYGYGDKVTYRKEYIRTFALQYRLGVLEKYPFGKGFEVGWMVQAPVALYKGSVASLELNGRFGLKPVVTPDGVFYHNLSAGWDIGQWVDNSWFLEYAAGFEHGRFTPYAGFRAILAGTDYIGREGDPLDFDEEEFGLGRFKPSKRSFMARVTAGTAISLGEIPVLPEYIIPEVSLIFPGYDSLHSVGPSFSVGFQWEFK